MVFRVSLSRCPSDQNFSPKSAMKETPLSPTLKSCPHFRRLEFSWRGPVVTKFVGHKDYPGLLGFILSPSRVTLVQFPSIRGWPLVVLDGRGLQLPVEVEKRETSLHYLSVMSVVVSGVLLCLLRGSVFHLVSVVSVSLVYSSPTGIHILVHFGRRLRTLQISTRSGLRATINVPPRDK